VALGSRLPTDHGANDLTDQARWAAYKLPTPVTRPGDWPHAAYHCGVARTPDHQQPARDDPSGLPKDERCDRTGRLHAVRQKKQFEGRILMTESFEDAPQPQRSAGSSPSTLLAGSRCWVVSKVDGLRIRDQASTDSRVNGRLSAGQSISASCRAQRGERYSDCGGSQWWIPVPNRGGTDYVAWACVDWFTSEPEPKPQRKYVVQAGDTLSGIARRFDVSLSALLRANPQIDDPDRIFPGQVIIIP
jgi:hypothetical protein